MKVWFVLLISIPVWVFYKFSLCPILPKLIMSHPAATLCFFNLGISSNNMAQYHTGNILVTKVIPYTYTNFSILKGYYFTGLTFISLTLLWNLIKILLSALAGVAQWIEHQPVNPKFLGLIPSQGTCLGCRPGAQ